MVEELEPAHIRLKNQIDWHFNLGELRSLCFDLQIDFDYFSNSGKLTIIEEFLLFCERKNRKQDLLTRLKELHPNVDWPSDYTLLSANLDITEYWTIFRENAQKHAASIIEEKSRILKPDGILPKLQPLYISFHDKNINYRFSKEREFKPERKLSPPMLLSDVVKRDQKILLLGDLGTGKSTMAGLLVRKLISANPLALAIFVPASVNSLKLTAGSTIQDILNGILTYFNDHISIRTPALEINDILKTTRPIYIVIDGLDEVSEAHAAKLLTLLNQAANHYPNLWFVTTGRPVELRGVNLQNWQIVTTLPLQDNDKLQFLQAEGVASGLSPKAASQHAKQLLKKLKSSPTLDSLASTPLTLRLLYSELLKTRFDEFTTLGDLLYSLLKERMGKWSQSDQKAKPLHSFEIEFPNELSRISLFGEFASKFELSKSFSIEQMNLNFRQLLESKISDNVNIFVLVKETIDFLIKSGILTNENDHIHYSIQPLIEFLSGYGVAEKWNQDKPTPDWVDTTHWRVVSFAATAVRKFGSVDRLRSYFLNYLSQLLTSQRNIPAACYILMELQDSECAKAFFDLLAQFGMRPLMIFGEEKDQSTLAIAITIKLAGQKGFDWFFDHYLDPRYPIVNPVRRLGDEVFEQWAYISQDQLSDYERSKLQKLIRPNVIANTHQTYSLIPTLAILMPEAFEPEEALWFSSKYLGKGIFSTQTEAYFIQEFKKANERLVNNILLQVANKGHETAKSAAWLWLHLNPNERPHALVLKTLLGAYGRSYLDVGRKEYLDLCIKRVGQKQWHQFIRWCLFHRNERFAAGAAIELYKFGEKRLSILGKPLLQAMHDGGYFKLAEETLHQIVKDLGSVAVNWLANQISKASNGLDGAHSGWWRIFLAELPSLAHDGPELLSSCIGGIGPYLLPRYPEVRLLFKDLLSSGYGDEYRKKLQESLNHINPTIRHGAAMVLLTCDPQNEFLALTEVIRLRHTETYGDWHEWETFCLNLSFSAHILTNLQAMLSTFEPASKVFALVLLYRNQIVLSEEDFTELVNGILEVGNRLLDAYEAELSVLADPRSFSILQSLISDSSRNESAAREIFQHHSEQMSSSLEIKCISLLASTASLPWYPNLHEQLEKMENEPDYVERVELAMKELAKNAQPPILELLRRAVVEEAEWETAVWLLLCDDRGFKFSLEDSGQWFLDLGRLKPQYRAVIGSAVRKFLSDARIQNSRRAEITQWLAILADEFIGLSQDDLRKALTASGSIVRMSATSALIARLNGEIPQQINLPSRSGAIPNSIYEYERKISTSLELFQQLQQLLLPSEELHPETCEIIEELCLEQPNSGISFSLSAVDINGILILNALSFIKGAPPDPLLVIPVLSSRITEIQMKNQCFGHLLDIWRYGQRFTIHEDDNLRKSYVQSLHKNLSRASEIFDIFASGAELLRLDAPITPPELETILTPYVRYIEHNDFGLSEELIRFFVNKWKSDMQTSYTLVIRNAIDALDMHSWGKNSKSAIRFLILPLSYWKLTGQNSLASNRVFLRGLKAAFSTSDENKGPVEIIGKIEPLLSSVSKENLEQAISYGETLSDPMVKGVCRLFSQKF